MKKIFTLVAILLLEGTMTTYAQPVLYGLTARGGPGGAGALIKFDPAANQLSTAFGWDLIGENPNRNDLVEFNGKLYGMTSNGGSNNSGTIFSFDPASNIHTELFDFNGTNGSVPLGSLIIYGSKLFGLTSQGGANNYGTIFSFDPNTNTHNKLFDFNRTNGSSPLGSLVEAGGKLYGITNSGGSSGYGTIFSFDPATNMHVKFIDFNYNNGGVPYSGMILSSDKLYGTTSTGGSYGSGTIFSFDPATNTQSKIYDFDGSNGYSPRGSLVEYSGKFYGVTLQNSIISGFGTIFSFDPATGSYAKLFDFSGINGRSPQGSMVEYGGKLYGVTSGGGTSEGGTIFSYEPASNAHVKLFDFGGFNGSGPSASFIKASGKFYGMTPNGGFGRGTIFSFNPSTNTHSKLFDFNNINGYLPSGSLIKYRGKLYGMTQQGGSSGSGTIFSFDETTNTHNKLFDFDGTNGRLPYGSLIEFGDKFYGMTYGGGSGFDGTIFSFDPSSNAYSKLFDFNDANGGSPIGSLIVIGGQLYGMTLLGGSSGFGTIFSFDPVAKTHNKLFDFNGSNGGFPYSSFVEYGGILYGMTSQGGSSGGGTIFSFNPATNTHVMLFEFNGTNGNSPIGSLEEFGGRFYGMTQNGGSNFSGTIFSFDPSGSIHSKLFDFSNASGRYPLGTLKASGDKLYGMTWLGGSSDVGTIFSFDPATNTHVKLQDFNQNNGAAPYFNAAFIEVKPCSTTPEICDGIDNDCDGQIDEGVQTTLYQDNDGDGFGNPAVSIQACLAPTGYVADNTDCDDADADRYPGATEICDGIDNNCNGQIDEGLTFVTYYRDQDNDGYGDASQSQSSCSALAGYVTQSGDCNDNNAAINPGTVEVCNGIDDNCDGQIDESVQNLYYPDADGDGFGLDEGAVLSCTPPVINPTPYWIWMGGDKVAAQVSVYGSQGIPAPGNKPGARAHSASWTDAQGRLWLMGGSLFASTSADGLMNDLWRFNPETNEWAWIKGNNIPNQAGVFGSRGLSSAANNPSARWGMARWRDFEGNLWMMGGFSNTLSYGGAGAANDLWKYDPLSNQWTWMKGDQITDQLGVYGTIGVGSPSNNPGGRREAGFWTDQNGNFWLFGGLGFAASGSLSGLNDLWKFDISQNNWTWVKGPNSGSQSGNYGTKGVSNPSNNPGARYGSAIWTDKQGNFWLMGGNVGGGSTSVLNDLWKFNPVTNEWVYMSGDNIPNQPSIYGTKGVSSPDNKPGARYRAASWVDQAGSLWLMGGWEFDPISGGFGELNDVWKYDPLNNEWTWVSGDAVSRQNGVYGSKGVEDPANKPGSRQGAANWVDAQGNFWIMGGIGYGENQTFWSYLNDLWKLSLKPATKPFARVSGSEMEVSSTEEAALSYFVSVGGDCNDKDNTIYPGAPELCDGKDNDCDGTIDDGITFVTYYRDQDGDGYGDASQSQSSCSALQGYVTTAGDCNDNNGAVNPAATEVCNGIDDDCDGTIDEGVLNTYYPDADGDGFGKSTGSIQACSAPAGFVTSNTDCNDNNAAIKPGATEVCGNNIDDDCDGQVDEGCTTTTLPKVFIGNSVIIEGNNGTRSMVFTVWLNKPSTLPVTVQFATSNQTATAGQDYIAKTGMVSFAPRTLVQYVTVTVSGDRMFERDETLRVGLSSATNATINTSFATGTIFNDDRRPGIRVEDLSVTENSQRAQVKVELTNPSSETVRVRYETQNLSARSPQDYTAVAGELSFLPGETSKFVNVPIVWDALPEPTEVFRFRLKDAVNASLERDHDGRKEATVSIRNSAAPVVNNSTMNQRSPLDLLDESTPLQVKVLPNPSPSRFTLNFSGGSNEPIQLRVTDILGRVVEGRKLPAGTQTVQVGDAWINGSYILEVIQGTERKTIQLVKMR